MKLHLKMINTRFWHLTCPLTRHLNYLLGKPICSFDCTKDELGFTYRSSFPAFSIVLFADIGSIFSEEGKQTLGSSAKTSCYWEYVPNAMRLSLAKSSLYLYIHIYICIGEGNAMLPDQPALSGWQGFKDSEIFRTVLDHSNWSISPSFCFFLPG